MTETSERWLTGLALAVGAIVFFSPVLIAIWKALPHSDRIADAERRYEFVAKNGSLDDLCTAAGAVRAAYLEQEDASQFRFWHIRTDLDCMKARQEGGYLPADDAERAKIQIAAAVDIEADLNAIDLNAVDANTDAGFTAAESESPSVVNGSDDASNASSEAGDTDQHEGE